MNGPGATTELRAKIMQILETLHKTMVEEGHASQDWGSFVKSLVAIEKGMPDIEELRQQAEANWQDAERHEAVTAVQKVADIILKHNHKNPAKDMELEAFMLAWKGLKADVKESLEDGLRETLQHACTSLLGQFLAIMHSPATHYTESALGALPAWCEVAAEILEVKGFRDSDSANPLFQKVLHISKPEKASFPTQYNSPAECLGEDQLEADGLAGSLWKLKWLGVGVAPRDQVVGSEDTSLQRTKLLMVKKMGEFKAALQKLAGDTKTGFSAKSRSALAKLAGHATACTDVNDFKSVTEEQKKSLEKWLASPEVKAAMSTLHNEQKRINEAVTKATTDKLVQVIESCKELSGGCSGGASWRHGMDGANFVMLCEKAKQQLLTAAVAGELRKQLDSLSQERPERGTMKRECSTLSLFCRNLTPQATNHILL